MIPSPFRRKAMPRSASSWARTGQRISALRKANFRTVRGPFKFNNNHYPIQNLYIMEVK